MLANPLLPQCVLLPLLVVAPGVEAAQQAPHEVGGGHHQPRVQQHRPAHRRLQVLLGEQGSGLQRGRGALRPAPHRVGEVGIGAHNAAQVEQLLVEEFQQAQGGQGREDLGRYRYITRPILIYSYEGFLINFM